LYGVETRAGDKFGSDLEVVRCTVQVKGSQLPTILIYSLVKTGCN